MSSSGVNLPALDASGPRTCNPYAPPRRRLFLSEKACDEGAGQACGGTGGCAHCGVLQHVVASDCSCRGASGGTSCRTNRYGPASIFTAAKPDCADHDQPQQCCPAGPETGRTPHHITIRHRFSSMLAGEFCDCGTDQPFDGRLVKSLRVRSCPGKEHIPQGPARQFL